MGIFRKTMSVSTVGLVSYRNKDERATKIAKQTRNAARAQVAQQGVDLQIQREQAAQLAHLNAQTQARRWEAETQAIAPPPPVQAGPPPGWYKDPEGPSQRWWDGVRWTEHRT